MQTAGESLKKLNELAAELWASGIHEARILASILDVPALVDETQMEAWAAAFDSRDIVDQCCGNLFESSRYGNTKALEWADREDEFVRRAAFSLMAYIAVHNKALPDAPAVNGLFFFVIFAALFHGHLNQGAQQIRHVCEDFIQCRCFRRNALPDVNTTRSQQVQAHLFR